MGLFSTVFEMFGDIRQESQIFRTTPEFNSDK